MKKISTILLMALLCISVSNAASRYYVSTGGDDDNTGTSWEDAFATIGKAVTTANQAAFDENIQTQVWVKQGTYVLESQLNMRDSVSVYGGFAGQEVDLSSRSTDASLTIVDANETGRVLNQAENFDVLVIWDGFTFQNGKINSGTSSGAAGVNLKVNGKVVNCIIKNNVANANGAGAYLSGGYLLNCTIEGNKIDLLGTTNASNFGAGVYITEKGTVENCILKNNSVDPTVKSANSRGGGICANKGGQITGCTFINNSAFNGGGLWVSTDATGEAPNIVNCKFLNNNAWSLGGGAYATINSGASTSTFYSSFINCLFANNSSGSSDTTTPSNGGGVYCTSQSALTFGNKLINCTIVNNKSTYAGATATSGDGGGIYLNQANQILNCVVWGNEASATGAKKQIRQNTHASAYAVNCAIQSLNQSDLGAATVKSGLISLAADNSDVKFKTPSTAPGQNGTGWDNADWRVNVGSLCINAGLASYSGTSAPAKDLVGVTRPATPTIGAYEYSANPTGIIHVDKGSADNGAIVSVSYYTLTGIQVAQPSTRGVYIQKVTFENGVVKTSKVMLK